jgi:hypothetical protein
MPDDQRTIDNGAAPENWKELASYLLIGLGALSLLRTSRILSLALAGAWLYDVAGKSEGSRALRDRDIKSRRRIADRIDAQVEDTFPASDPPSFSGVTSGPR